MINSLQSSNIYSGFGKIIEARYQTSPFVKFGKDNRKNNKVFNTKKEIKFAKISHESPGPMYKPNMKLSLPNNPAYSFKKSVSDNNLKKFQHDIISDLNFNPDDACKFVLKENTIVEFKKSKRVSCFKTN